MLQSFSAAIKDNKTLLNRFKQKKKKKSSYNKYDIYSGGRPN